MVLGQSKDLEIIGSTEYIEVAGIKDVPAKIDTGADSSSIWASQIQVTKEGVLKFCLFDQSSPFYTGEELERSDFKVAVIRSSSGHEQVRYRTHIKTTLNGRKIKILYTLSDRSHNNFPILIGRRSISGKFLVDVSVKHANVRHKSVKTKIVQRRLKEDPYKFHQEYFEKDSNH